MGKNGVRLKMDQKGHIIDQRAKNIWKRVKIEFLDLKYLLFSGTEGGIPPLNGKSFCPEKLIGVGGTSPLLIGKNPYFADFLITIERRV